MIQRMFHNFRYDRDFSMLRLIVLVTAVALLISLRMIIAAVVGLLLAALLEGQQN